MSSNLTRREREKREQQLPEWAHGLSCRLQGALINERVFAELADLSVETVRAHGEMQWLRAPNLGRKGVAELGGAIGGWDTGQENLSSYSDAVLIRELRRRGYHLLGWDC